MMKRRERKGAAARIVESAKGIVQFITREEGDRLREQQRLEREERRARLITEGKLAGPKS